MRDPIERQDVIDTLDVGSELLKRVLDNSDIVGAERAKYEWGLDLIKSYIADVKELPSANPEIIRCKDCKHYRTTGAFGTPLRKEDRWCDAENFPDEGQKELPEWWFCAGAERREE